MSSETTDETQRPVKKLRSGRSRRSKFPSWFVIVLVIVAISIAVSIQQFAYRLDEVASLDRATLNIYTLIASFVAFMTLAIWYLLSSDFTIRTRMLSSASFITLVVMFFGLFELVSVDADLVPTFRPRWEPPADTMLAKPTAKAVQIDLKTTTPADFPQFLGPSRDGVLPNVRLQRDWSKHPPKKIWRQPIGAGHSAFAAVNGFAVTMEQRGNEEMVSCYEIATGELRWWHSIKARHHSTMGDTGPRATPTIHEGRVYALGATGVLRCLNGDTGDLIWSNDLLDQFGVASAEKDMKAIAWGRANSPLVVDDVVVVPAGGPQGGPYVSLVAYDQRTGEEVWRGGDQQASYSSPSLITIGGVRQIVIVNEATVSGHFFDQASSGGSHAVGEKLWRFEWPGSSNTGANVSQTHVLAGDKIFASKGYGEGAAVFQLSVQDGQFSATEDWHKHAILKTKFTNVVMHEGHAYGLSDGILECADVSTGKRKWKKRGRFGHGQVLLVGDLLLVLGEEGELTLLDISPDGAEELGQIQAIDGKSWNNLCLHGDQLLVRNGKEAACYQLAIAPSEAKKANGS